MPEAPNDLHPLIKGWLAQHKRELAEHTREMKNRPYIGYWGKGAVSELTARDLDRFRATSAIFTAVERAGGRIVEAPIAGKVTFRVSDEKIECSIVEKMFKPYSGDGSWTAYPGHHQTGLHSTGFLRVTITTYLDGKKSEWIETQDKKVADLLPEIVKTIIAGGQILAQGRKDRQQAEQLRRVEEAHRQELQRAREIDDRRWAHFSRCADNLDQHTRLLALVAEIKKRVAAEGDMEVGGHTVSEWVQWAEARIAALDPLADGVGGLFLAVLAASTPPAGPWG